MKYLRWGFSKLLIFMILIPMMPFFLIHLFAGWVLMFADWCIIDRNWSGWLADKADKINNWGLTDF